MQFMDDLVACPSNDGSASAMVECVVRMAGMNLLKMGIRLSWLMVMVLVLWPVSRQAWAQTASRPHDAGDNDSGVRERPVRDSDAWKGDSRKDASGRRDSWRDRGLWRGMGDRPDTSAGPDDRPRPSRSAGLHHELSGDDFRDFLTAQEREDLMNFTKEQFPELYERFQRMQSGNRPEFGRMLRQAGWPLLRLHRLQKHDPELAEKLIAEHKIEMKLVELRRDYREFTSESARERMRTEIRGLMEKRFDLRQARLELEIRDLEKRLQNARERLTKQSTTKQQIVDSELEHFTDMAGEDRGWDEHSEGSEKPRPAPSPESPPPSANQR